ncbi:hypothetical protein OKW76_05025 [Sphingomonas sp. S1-29]|uniref:hypothetical protein n=1 Tax=Sphingomonas sp. S1-29 TaxID=2991074 RepID=UPI00224079F6|nr:hypothetical protein [Sphingomonas sp. S1-29]UZK70412.1 hypothetical protein OKW76_05025 [Sphingomonas sp. S1-29]
MGKTPSKNARLSFSGLSSDIRQSVSIEMDHLDLRFRPQKIGGSALSALVRRGVGVRALVRSGPPAAAQDAVRARGGAPVPADFADHAALSDALDGESASSRS